MQALTPQQIARNSLKAVGFRRHAGGVDIAMPDDAVGWIEKHFYIPETNAPIQLVPYQAAVIRKALERDSNGLFVNSLVLYSDIKKSAKSTISGAVALYLAWHNPYETVRIVGNDLKQAANRTFEYIERAVSLNPRLRDQCKVKQYHIELPNHTVIQAIPVDPKGEAGGGDLIICFTELWAMKNEASQRLWSETTLSPLKFGKSLRWGESYAGFTGQSPILENLYEVGVRQGRQVGSGVGIDDLELYANDSARMLTLWNTQPRCPWQTADYYTQEAATLLPSEFERMHRNQWQNPTEGFIALEHWLACKAEYPPLANDESAVMALDAGISSDCFAVVIVSRRDEKVYTHYSRAWIPPKGGQLDFAVIEVEIRCLLERYYIVEMAYDPYQLHDMAMRLKNEGLVYTRPFNQGTDRTIADKRLYDLIISRSIAYNGDMVLTEHIQNANRKAEDENRLRLVKRNPEGKIDLAVALSMAAHRSFAYTGN